MHSACSSCHEVEEAALTELDAEAIKYAIRCPKRRLSDIVYRSLLNDYGTAKTSGPGGHRRATLTSSAAGSHPHTSTSEKSLPGPVTTKPTTALPKAS